MSCGKKDNSSTTKILFHSANSSSAFSNGVVINAKKLASGEFFTFALNSSSTFFEKQISKGLWEFKIMGWIPNGTSESFEGTPKCGVTVKNLTLDIETVDINLSSPNCTTPAFNNNASNLDSSSLVKKITLVGCKTFSDPLTVSNGNCHFKKQLLGESLSYKVVFLARDEFTTGLGIPVLSSRCLTAPSLLDSVIQTQIRIPLGGAGDAFPVLIQGFEKDNCTMPDAQYFFSRGFGNPGFIHTVDTIIDYAYTTDDTKVYLADNFFGEGTSPFINQMIDFDCGGTHCFNTPTVRVFNTNESHTLSTYAREIFGTSDAIHEQDLDLNPRTTFSNGTDELIFEFNTFDTNGSAYTVDFAVGAPSAAYVAGTKTLTVTMTAASETLTNIAALMAGVTEFSVKIVGTGGTSFVIGTELPASSTLQNGIAQQGNKHRNLGIVDEINFFLLGPFGGLLARHGYTKCDLSADADNVLSAIGASFSEGFDGGHSIRVDVSAGTKNLTAIGGATLTDVKLSYFHNGAAIGIHEVSCDGTNDKAGFVRINQENDFVGNNDQVNYEIYYNEGTGLDSEIEIYRIYTGCSGNCEDQIVTLLKKDTADSFRLWVSTGRKSTTFPDSYERYSGAWDSSLDQFDIRSYYDLSTVNIEPDTLVEWNTAVTPTTDCRDVLGVTTTCSYVVSDPTRNPLLMADWSTSRVDLTSTFFANLFTILP